MERVSTYFEKISAHELHIPFNVQSPVLFVKEGDDVKEGQALYKKQSLGVAKVLDISKELSCKADKANEYMCRIDGEFVLAEEVIAEKVEFNGLVSKKVVAGAEGIINFDDLGKGIVKIMSEREETTEIARANCTILKIDLLKGITLAMDVKRLKAFAGKFKHFKEDLDIFAPKKNSDNVFKVIKGGDSVYTTNDLEPSYKNCIVFAGKFLYPNLFDEIIKRGAVLVIAYSMDYEDYISIANTGKILILGGFGHVNMQNFLLDEILDYHNKYVFIDESFGGTVYFPTTFIEKKVSREIKSLVGLAVHKDSTQDVEIGVEHEIGDTVVELRCYDSENFGLIGKFEGFVSDGEYVIISFDNGEKKIIGRTLVEVAE
jgi:hypothetical protein